MRGSERFDGWLYVPDRIRGALLLVPGLHYLGPADERLDRFLAILADAGLLVFCPFLPEFRRLRVGSSLVEDTAVAWETLLALPERPAAIHPGAFSISFGSYPALHLATRADGPSALTLFGGYASFEETIRFSLEGEAGRDFDPTNRPVVFLNALGGLDGEPRDPEPLRRAWITYVRRTWGRPALKSGGWRTIATEIERSLPDDARALFRIGVGLDPGGGALIDRALGRLDHGHLDPTDACRRVRCPTTIVHGRDDDVIPFTQAAKLHAMVHGSRLILTGLYAHTGHGGVGPRALIDELGAMVGILDAICATAQYR